MTILMTVGAVVHGFFEDYLKLQKGLRVNSIRSYRDAVRLFAVRRTGPAVPVDPAHARRLDRRMRASFSQ